MLLAMVIAVTAWALPVQATGNAQTQAVIVHMHDGENQLHLDVRTRSGPRPIGLEVKVPSSAVPTGVAIEGLRDMADTAITLVVRIEPTVPRSFDLPVELLADWEEGTAHPGRFTTVFPMRNRSVPQADGSGGVVQRGSIGRVRLSLNQQPCERRGNRANRQRSREEIGPVDTRCPTPQ